MNEPIHAGCLAEVVDGLHGKDSPNLGLVVRVVARLGETARFGFIWRCEAEFGERGTSPTDGSVIPPGQLDFAQSWLRKIPDPPLPAAAKNTEKELTA